jgi:hypothetical protein
MFKRMKGYIVLLSVIKEDKQSFISWTHGCLEGGEIDGIEIFGKSRKPSSKKNKIFQDWGHY